MWFRQGTQSVDTDRIRASIKNRMRRFRSPDKASNASVDEPDNVQPAPVTVLINKPPVICEDTDDENEIEHRRIAAAAATVQRSPSGKKLYKNDKDKTLLTDRKFKNKRIVKSASKSKLIVDSGDTKVRGVSLRKTSAPPVFNTDQVTVATPDVVTVTTASAALTVPKKHVRSHSNLNLNALLRYKLTNKKLSTAEFERLRRKSVTSEVVAVPVAEVKEVDTKSQHSSDDSSSEPTITLPTSESNGAAVPNGVHASDDDEEVFLSASEDANSSTVEVVPAQKKSPSLGARMAARFAESSSSKAKKASKLKKQQKEQQQQQQNHRKSSSGSELFKQNSFGKQMSKSYLISFKRYIERIKVERISVLNKIQIQYRIYYYKCQQLK